MRLSHIGLCVLMVSTVSACANAGAERRFSGFSGTPSKVICLKEGRPLRPVTGGDKLFGTGTADDDGVRLELEAAIVNLGFKFDCGDPKRLELSYSYSGDKYTSGRGWLYDKMAPQVLWTVSLKEPAGREIAFQSDVTEGFFERPSTVAKERVIEFLKVTYGAAK